MRRNKAHPAAENLSINIQVLGLSIHDRSAPAADSLAGQQTHNFHISTAAAATTTAVNISTR